MPQVFAGWAPSPAAVSSWLASGLSPPAVAPHAVSGWAPVSLVAGAFQALFSG
ncbi:hypothetical protein [Actinomadura gamaensis]|uniref:Uncharacterized protein n=1 Tax=Actinomadura gamaensis TaxID=1763541 RepID=A0ABV9UBK1_9ACTN